jgi:phosphoenolpyruvate synthase/pyruvate phosphate dikinase
MRAMALEAVRSTDLARVGGKAALLGTLRDAGFPIPPGLCITTAAFRLAIAAFFPQIRVLLAQADLHDPGGIATTADAVQRLLLDLTIPDTLVRAVNAALNEQHDAWSLLAVRLNPRIYAPEGESSWSVVELPQAPPQPWIIPRPDLRRGELSVQQV